MIRFPGNRPSRSITAGWTTICAMLLSLSSAYGQAANACDLNSDGAVNSADVTVAVNMSLGSANCTANVIGSGTCNAVVVQRVINAIGGLCVTGTARSVNLTWVASTTSTVTGYNVYRTTTSGNGYVLLTPTPVTGFSYTDDIVQGGVSYYYVVRAVDSAGNISPNSNEATAVVPAS